MTERITGVVDRLSNADDYDSIKWILGAPVENVALSVVDDTIKDNADFQSSAGLQTTVTRYTTSEKPCAWCQGLEGTYTAEEANDAGVWHRHVNCRCVIEYESATTGGTHFLRGTGRKWQRVDPSEIAKRKSFEGVNVNPQKIVANDMSLKYGKENYKTIEDMVARADDDAKKVWNKYVDDIGVKSTTHKGTAFFRASEEGIYLDVNADKAGSYWSKPFQTTFHESGHNLDYLAGGRNPWQYYSMKYDNGAFRNAIIKDYEELVAAKETELKKAFKEGNRKLLRDNGLRLDISETKYYKRYTYQAIENQIRGEGWVNASSVSDITEGASKAKVRAGFGHGGKKYWERYGALEKEAFAEFTEATFANPGELDTLKKYYPRAYKVYRDMIEELAK